MLKRSKTQRHLRDRKRSQERKRGEKHSEEKRKELYFLELVRDLTVILNK